MVFLRGESGGGLSRTWSETANPSSLDMYELLHAKSHRPYSVLAGSTSATADIKL